MQHATAFRHQENELFFEEAAPTPPMLSFRTDEYLSNGQRARYQEPHTGIFREIFGSSAISIFYFQYAAILSDPLGKVQYIIPETYSTHIPKGSVGESQKVQQHYLATEIMLNFIYCNSQLPFEA
jgi:hypothetical protein